MPSLFAIFGITYVTPIILSPFIAKLIAKIIDKLITKFNKKRNEFDSKYDIYVNHYEIIGVEIGCKFSDITRIYKEKALQMHPDKLNGFCDGDFVKITNSYNELKNKHKNNELEDYCVTLKAKQHVEYIINGTKSIVDYFDSKNNMITIGVPIIISFFWPLLLTGAAYIFYKLRYTNFNDPNIKKNERPSLFYLTM